MAAAVITASAWPRHAHSLWFNQPCAAPRRSCGHQDLSRRRRRAGPSSFAPFNPRCGKQHPAPPPTDTGYAYCIPGHAAPTYKKPGPLCPDGFALSADGAGCARTELSCPPGAALRGGRCCGAGCFAALADACPSDSAREEDLCGPSKAYDDVIARVKVDALPATTAKVGGARLRACLAVWKPPGVCGAVAGQVECDRAVPCAAPPCVPHSCRRPTAQPPSLNLQEAAPGATSFRLRLEPAAPGGAAEERTVTLPSSAAAAAGSPAALRGQLLPKCFRQCCKRASGADDRCTEPERRSFAAKPTIGCPAGCTKQGDDACLCDKGGAVPCPPLTRECGSAAEGGR